jgi:FkbM family methyltransferase
MKILAHTSFIGTTGYANHAKSFFCALNKYHTVKVRNLTIGNSWKGMNDRPHDGESYFTDEMAEMLILQTLHRADGNGRVDEPIYGYKGDFIPDVHIVLAETNNYYFYNDYDGYKIAYNVWESTRYPHEFFNRLFYFDEVWVPTQWQFDCLVEQGYPAEKISIVPEGVDIETFKPIKDQPIKDKFRFLHFGRWDYRKGTTEVLKTFGEVFAGRKDVELIASVENPYPYDGMNSTEERIDYHKINTENIKFIKFTPREDYIKYLQEGHVFVSCARSEGWNLPLIEAMACGTPSIYSNWGGQLEFAEGKGIPVKISHMRPANIEHKNFPGEYCEPDWEDLGNQMLNAYNDYNKHKSFAMVEAAEIQNEFNWDNIAKIACDILERKDKTFAFVTTGNIGYMPVIEKLVQSLLMFSKHKIIVLGVDCEVPFDYPNVIKNTINPPKISEHDKWYWKQHACIEALKYGYDYLIWIDGDVVVNHNIDSVKKYFNLVDKYPLSDIHVQEEFFGMYDNGTKSQLFNEEIAKYWGINKQHPYMHVCFFIYNVSSIDFFKEIINTYEILMENNPEDYKKYFLWNDEGIDNALRWKHGYNKHLPLSNFDTSSYDGDEGFIDKTMHQFLKFWNEDGPQNFDRIFGYQYIPKDKSQIIYFHGNKNAEISDRMVQFIQMQRDNSFWKSMCFYTDIYKLEDYSPIFEYEGSTMQVAEKFGWAPAIFHEIYNLRDYYREREKKINDGDIVVDLGGNIGVFNRWAHQEGAGKVISFEPDKRYFKLLSLNAGPNAILFNAAVSHEMGELNLYESPHLGGSNVFGIEGQQGYSVRTYTLNYLFESGLVDRIDFLKIDIEGAEHAALAGISDENLMKVKTISMEYHHSHFDYDISLRDEMTARLNRVGFNSMLYYTATDNLQMIYFWR